MNEKEAGLLGRAGLVNPRIFLPGPPAKLLVTGARNAQRPTGARYSATVGTEAFPLLYMRLFMHSTKSMLFGMHDALATYEQRKTNGHRHALDAHSSDYTCLTTNTQPF
jgi:hypothetical protein